MFSRDLYNTIGFVVRENNPRNGFCGCELVYTSLRRRIPCIFREYSGGGQRNPAAAVDLLSDLGKSPAVLEVSKLGVVNR